MKHWPVVMVLLLLLGVGLLLSRPEAGVTEAFNTENLIKLRRITARETPSPDQDPQKLEQETLLWQLDLESLLENKKT